MTLEIQRPPTLHPDRFKRFFGRPPVHSSRREYKIRQRERLSTQADTNGHSRDTFDLTDQKHSRYAFYEEAC